MSKGTYGARIIAFSSNGKALDVFVVEGHCGQNHAIKKRKSMGEGEEEELTILIMTYIVNRKINLYDQEAPSPERAFNIFC
jgi:hypothetical protein